MAIKGLIGLTLIPAAMLLSGCGYTWDSSGMRIVVDGQTSYVSTERGEGSGVTTEGSGTRTTDHRMLPTFDAVSVYGPFNLDVTVGDAGPVDVTIDDNLQALIETVVEDGRLKIRPIDSFSTRVAPEITVRVPQLTGLAVVGSGDAEVHGLTGKTVQLSVQGSGDLVVHGSCDTTNVDVAGSGDILVNNIDAATVDVEIAGSGSVKLNGTTDDLAISIAGSGDVKALSLEATEVGVAIAGSGDVYVNASEWLDISIAGSGDVTYTGTPRVKQSVAGSGDVHHRD